MVGMIDPSERSKCTTGVQVTETPTSRANASRSDRVEDLRGGDRASVYDLVSYRNGDMWAPRLDQTEALQLEARYFLDCVARSEALNDGRAGLRVVRMLEAADESAQAPREIVYTGSGDRSLPAPPRPSMTETPWSSTKRFPGILSRERKRSIALIRNFSARRGARGPGCRVFARWGARRGA